MRDRRGTDAVRDLLQNEIVGLAFYEGSTRTRVSFELAARDLGATVVDLSIAGSSVAKGESLVDTLRTLERAGVTMLVLRHGASGAPYLASRTTRMRIINGGDGLHAHPTQALCDALTLRDALGGADGRTILIVGDVAHSRVARSNLHALRITGFTVRVAGPPSFVAGMAAWPGVSVAPTIEEALSGADAVMALRIQVERAAASGIPSVSEYVERWGLTEERLELARPGAVVLHPGPTNEGIEVTAALANGPRSLIARQVEWGVPVRMAVMGLLAGAV
jgi:aspartate carbamoyltransferase catalytic subunit